MKIAYTYWKEADGMFLGYLNEFPDHWTQGVDLEELKENLRRSPVGCVPGKHCGYDMALYLATHNPNQTLRWVTHSRFPP